MDWMDIMDPMDQIDPMDWIQTEAKYKIPKFNSFPGHHGHLDQYNAMFSMISSAIHPDKV